MRFSLFFLLLGTSLFAAPVITTTATCSNADGVYPNLSTVSVTSDSGACHLTTNISGVDFSSVVLNNGPQYSSGNATGSLSLTANGFRADLSASAYAYPLSTSDARVNFVDTFTTAGPVRTGVVRGWFYPNTFRYGGSLDFGVTVPGLPYGTFTEQAPPIPIILGQPFTFSAFLFARAVTDDYTPSSAMISTPFYLNFFEADGVTPVALSEVPEPTTWAFGALGIAGVIGLKRLRRN